MNGKGNRIDPRKKRILVVSISVVAVAILVAASYYLIVAAQWGHHSGIGIAPPDVGAWNNSTKVVDGRSTFYDTFIIGAGFRDPYRSANASQWKWSFFTIYENSSNNSITKTAILPYPALCTNNPPGMAGCAAPATGWYLVISNRNWSWIASYPETRNGTIWYGDASVALDPGNLLTIVSPNKLAGASYQILWSWENGTIVGGVDLNNPSPWPHTV